MPTNNRCDGTINCGDGSDEQDCPPCGQYEFECVLDKRCINRAQICNGRNDCLDGIDELQCDNNINIPGTIPRSTSAQYTVGVVVGAVAMLFIFIFVWFACRRRGYEAGIVVQFDSSHSTVIAKPATPFSTAPHNTLQSCRGKASGATYVSSLSASTRFYDRNHITGASSSSSAITQYPHETLNPPPSPVTERALSSATDSTLTSYRQPRARRYVPPPPTTPCGTDICDDSESYTPLNSNADNRLYEHNHNPHYQPHKYKNKHKHRQSIYRYNTMSPDSYCDTSDSFYSPTHNTHTPHNTHPINKHHPKAGGAYFSPEGSTCSPSPSTERSFFNPFPPPPSPEATSE